jgi:acyl-coenzyme A thioesterase PaaI-like protein
MRVGDVAVGDGLRVQMAVGPWMRAPGGVQLAAALGVLVDDVVGVESHLHRPAGTYSVTTELSLDVIAPPPWDGPELTATSRFAGTSGVDGVSGGEIRDGASRVIALVSGRSRWVPVAGVHAGVEEVVREPPRRLPPERHDSILEALGIAELADALVFDPDLPLEIARLHGTPQIPSPRAAVEAAAMRPPAGCARLAIPPLPAFGNASGTMHGGIQLTGMDLAASALDGALGPDPAPGAFTTSVRMNLLRPAALTDPVWFTASALSRGRSLSVYRVTASGPAGRPYSVATVTRSTLF